MPAQCKTIYDIISKTTNLEDDKSNLRINAALIRQNITNVINGYENLFDLIDEFVSLVSDLRHQFVKLNAVHKNLISFDRINDNCYIVLQPNYELSITVTIHKDDPKKTINSKIVLEDQAPIISTIQTLSAIRDEKHYQYIDESIKSSIIIYLESFVDEYLK